MTPIYIFGISAFVLFWIICFIKAYIDCKNYDYKKADKKWKEEHS